MVMATALYRGVFSKLVDSDKTGTSSDINNYFSASSVSKQNVYMRFCHIFPTFCRCDIRWSSCGGVDHLYAIWNYF